MYIYIYIYIVYIYIYIYIYIYVYIISNNMSDVRTLQRHATNLFYSGAKFL